MKVLEENQGNIKLWAQNGECAGEVAVKLKTTTHKVSGFCRSQKIPISTLEKRIKVLAKSETKLDIMLITGSKYSSVTNRLSEAGVCPIPEYTKYSEKVLTNIRELAKQATPITEISNITGIRSESLREIGKELDIRIGLENSFFHKFMTGKILFFEPSKLQSLKKSAKSFGYTEEEICDIETKFRLSRKEDLCKTKIIEQEFRERITEYYLKCESREGTLLKFIEEGLTIGFSPDDLESIILATRMTKNKLARQ